MLLESFALSSTAAAVLGVSTLYEYKKLLKGEVVPDEKITELKGFKTFVRIAQDRAKVEIPSYVTVGGHAGISLPISGGVEIREEALLEKAVHSDESQSLTGRYITDFREKNEADVRYLNTADDLENFCSQHKIEKYTFPVTLPLKVYTIEAPESVYKSNQWRLLGSDRTAVVRKSIQWRSRPLRILGAVAALSGLLVAVDWQQQKYRVANYLRKGSYFLRPT